jgi:hypothetical protein
MGGLQWALAKWRGKKAREMVMGWRGGRTSVSHSSLFRLTGSVGRAQDSESAGLCSISSFPPACLCPHRSITSPRQLWNSQPRGSDVFLTKLGVLFLLFSPNSCQGGNHVRWGDGFWNLAAYMSHVDLPQSSNLTQNTCTCPQEIHLCSLNCICICNCNCKNFFNTCLSPKSTHRYNYGKHIIKYCWKSMSSCFTIHTFSSFYG